MASEVILTINDPWWGGWAKKFVARQPQARVRLTIPDNPTPAQTAQVIIGALQRAGTDGTLIISVGHGGVVTGVGTVDGTCDIAPNDRFKLGSRNVTNSLVNVFYDLPATPSGQSDLDYDLKNNPSAPRLANWRLYKSIADTCKSLKLYRVIFLTCNVGNAEDFIQKIANDWGVVVFAYKRRVVCEIITTTQPGRPALVQRYVYLQGETVPYPTAEANIIAQEEIPYRPALTVRIGPPLAQSGHR
jgi:hypothetical protein